MSRIRAEIKGIVDCRGFSAVSLVKIHLYLELIKKLYNIEEWTELHQDRDRALGIVLEGLCCQGATLIDIPLTAWQLWLLRSSP